jgi:hypothetical protein
VFGCTDAVSVPVAAKGSVVDTNLFVWGTGARRDRRAACGPVRSRPALPMPSRSRRIRRSSRGAGAPA